MDIRQPLPKEDFALQKVDVADYICHYLEQIGTRYIFGLPGGSLEPFFSALARSQKRGGITPVISRHEAGAAFIADGYARETGKLGVCCATTGPGATNMITGVASAYQDNTPLLVITAQSSLHTFGKGAVQESSCTGVSTTAMYAFCTRYNSLVSHENQIGYKLQAAIQAAYFSPVKGPAHLSIPIDIFRKSIDIAALKNLPKRESNTSTICDISTIQQLINQLKNSNKTVFLIGTGANGALREILECASLLNASVVSTPDAKGLLNSYHPLYFGVFGFAGHDQAYEAVADPQVDTVVAIGTRLDELSTHGWDNKVLLTNKLIHVDCNPEHFYQSPMAALHVFGSPHLVFSKVYEGLNEHALPNSPTLRQATSLSEFKHNPALSEVVKHKGHLRVIESARPTPTADQLAFSARNFTLNDEEKCFSEASPIKPQRLMFELSRLFPPSTRYVADIGNAFLWAIHYLQPKDRRIGGTRSATAGMLRIGMGYSSMGWGIGGAIGTAFGCPDCPIVTVVGDGSLLMNGQEITVALEHHLNVIFVVLNDAAYGTVKHGQAMAKAEPIGYELPKVDFKLFAEAMGIPAYTIHSPSDLLKLDINALCRRGGPTLLDVHIDGDEIPPLASRIKVLGWDLEKEVKQ